MAWPLVQASDSKSLLVSGALLKPHVNVLLQLFASILFNREMKRNRNILSKTKTNLSRTNTKSSFPDAAYRRDTTHQLLDGAGGLQTFAHYRGNVRFSQVGLYAPDRRGEVD